MGKSQPPSPKAAPPPPDPNKDEQAKASATRWLGEKLNADERIGRAYRLCFGRAPTTGERTVTVNDEASPGSNVTN